MAPPGHPPPRRNGGKDKLVDDLAELRTPDEKTVLDVLRSRFEGKRNSYTYCGVQMICLSPIRGESKSVPTISREKGCDRAELEPSVFAVAEKVYRRLERDKRDQSIILTGERGSGKSENAKRAINYLSTTTAKEQSLTDRLNSVTKILEAFGNADTRNCRNSSRFGKFIQLQYNRDHQMIGAVLQTYPLDGSKLVSQAKNERNFHVFYQLLSVKDRYPDLLLGELQDFHYLNQGNRVGSANAGTFDSAIKDSMKTLGVSNEQQCALFRVLAALLHLGNVEFKKHEPEITDFASCFIPKTKSLETTLKLLQIDQAEVKTLRKWLCYRRMLARGDELLHPRSVKEASRTRDNLAKFIYSRIVDWLVTRANAALRSPCAVQSYVGVLDLTGFEITRDSDADNFLEQFWINCSSEKLEQWANVTKLHYLQSSFAKEEVQWTRVEFECSYSTDVIKDVIDALNEATRFSQMNVDANVSWIENLKKKCGKHEHFKKSNDSESSVFVIKHFFGDVRYDASEFVEKNSHVAVKELLEILKKSKNEFFKKLVAQALTKMTPPTERRKTAIDKRASSTNNSFIVKTVISDFRSSLSTLTAKLEVTDPYYVRCIRANDDDDDNQSDKFDPKCVARQLRAFQVLNVIEFSAKTCTYQLTYDRFLQRYHGVGSSKCLEDRDVRATCRSIVENVLGEIGGYEFGKTKIFLKEKAVERLELLRSNRRKYAIVKIQCAVRLYLQLKRSKEVRRAVLIIQRGLRNFLRRRRLANEEKKKLEERKEEERDVETKEDGTNQEEVKNEETNCKQEEATKVEEMKQEVMVEEPNQEELNIEEIKQEEATEVEEIKREEVKVSEETKQEEAKVEEMKQEAMIEETKQEEVKIEEIEQEEETKVEEPNQEEVKIEETKQEEAKIEEMKQEVKVEESNQEEKEEVNIEETKQEEIKVEEPNQEEAQDEEGNRQKLMNEAATEIQRRVRGFLARRARDRRLRDIVLVQACIRRRLAQLELAKLKSQRSEALTILTELEQDLECQLTASPSVLTLESLESSEETMEQAQTLVGPQEQQPTEQERPQISRPEEDESVNRVFFKNIQVVDEKLSQDDAFTLKSPGVVRKKFKVNVLTSDNFDYSSDEEEVDTSVVWTEEFKSSYGKLEAAFKNFDEHADSVIRTFGIKQSEIRLARELRELKENEDIIDSSISKSETNLQQDSVSTSLDSTGGMDKIGNYYLGMLQFSATNVEEIVHRIVVEPNYLEMEEKERRLPAQLIFMMIRYADTFNDGPTANRVINGYSNATKLAAKAHAQQLESFAHWIGRTHDLLNFTKQYSKPGGKHDICHRDNRAQQRENLLRNLDLEREREILEELGQWLGRKALKHMKKSTLELAVPNLLSFAVPTSLEETGKGWDLSDKCTEFYESFRKHGIELKIVARLFRGLFEFLSSLALSSFMGRTELFDTLHATIIRCNIRTLESWAFSRNILLAATEGLASITEAVRLIQRLPISYADINEVCGVIKKLTYTQVIDILSNYKPAENEEAITSYTIQAAKLMLTSKLEDCEDTILLDDEKIKFPFVHSDVQFEKVEVPAAFNLNMLKKI